MNLPAMLLAYRANANPQMVAIAAEFQQLSASEQRELLFWMVVDTATNPTHLQAPRAPTAEEYRRETGIITETPHG